MPYDHQHLALSVAAAVAYRQLAPGRALRFYDADHLNEAVCLVAHALSRVAPIYVTEKAGERRVLLEAELFGAVVSRGATRLTLQDGCVFTEMSMRRNDLRDAILILKATGLQLLSRAAGTPLKD
jgi:hypothetical protein